MASAALLNDEGFTSGCEWWCVEVEGSGGVVEAFGVTEGSRGAVGEK